MTVLTLEVRHPRTGLIRIDSVGGGTLTLFPEGDTSPLAPRLSFDGPALALRWGVGDGFELSSQHLEYRRNGFTETRDTTLLENDRIEWHDFTLSVTRALEFEPELILQAKAAQTSNPARVVFADWLEGRGQLELAQWARSALPGQDLDRVELGRLARALTMRERALVSCAPIERCFSECGRSWQDLPLAEKGVCQRTCPQCSMEVTFFESTRRLSYGGPIVLCPSAAREPGDLWPEVVVG